MSDPLLTPYRLKHLELRNRIFSSAHGPADAEGGMPTDRYRLYHEEKAKGGVALTMTAGSAVVAQDSPPPFGNLHAYDDAAERMQAGGIDGIELQSYGHLFDAWWSPGTNRRSDEWGSDFDNRLRFPWLVLEAVRERVGPDFIVGLRIFLEETVPGGFDLDTGMEILRRLEASGLIDFINVAKCSIHNDVELTSIVPIHGMASAPMLDFAGRVRQDTTLPVLHAAKIDDVATARHAIAEGRLDPVGMTRAQIADPHLVNKIIEGRESEIWPCVGATYCLDRIYEAGEALCLHNAATSREATMPHVIERATAQRRVVLVATGGLPQLPGLESGADLVSSSWDVLGGDVTPTGSVPFFDDNGTHSAMSAAEMIARSGRDLEIVTPERMLGIEVGGMNHAPYARAFNETDTRITLSQRLLSVRPKAGRLCVEIGSNHSAHRAVRHVDHVVVDHGTQPLAELYFDLKPQSSNLGAVDYGALMEGRTQQLVRNAAGMFQLMRIGDAVASRNVHGAVLTHCAWSKTSDRLLIVSGEGVENEQSRCQPPRWHRLCRVAFTE